MHDPVSYHWFRRTARWARKRLLKMHPAHAYVVEPARRGPYKWALYRVR